MKQQPSPVATLGRVTDEVRRILGDTKNEPVGVLSAYRNSVLRLADAIDRLRREDRSAGRATITTHPCGGRHPTNLLPPRTVVMWDLRPRELDGAAVIS